MTEPCAVHLRNQFYIDTGVFWGDWEADWILVMTDLEFQLFVYTFLFSFVFSIAFWAEYVISTQCYFYQGFFSHRSLMNTSYIYQND